MSKLEGWRPGDEQTECPCSPLPLRAQAIMSLASSNVCSEDRPASWLCVLGAKEFEFGTFSFTVVNHNLSEPPISYF